MGLNRKNEILANCVGEEVEIQCAVWSAEIKDSYRYEAEPKAPYVYEQLIADMGTVHWRERKRDEKQEIVKRVLAKAEVDEYLNKVSKVIATNTSNANWLEQCIKWLVEWDEKLLAAELWSIYRSYPQTIGSTWYKKHSSVFSREPTPMDEGVLITQPPPPAEDQIVFDMCKEVGLI